jgi:hypothetical protein
VVDDEVHDDVGNPDLWIEPSVARAKASDTGIFQLEKDVDLPPLACARLARPKHLHDEEEAAALRLEDRAESTGADLLQDAIVADHFPGFWMPEDESHGNHLRSGGA